MEAPRLERRPGKLAVAARLIAGGSRWDRDCDTCQQVVHDSGGRPLAADGRPLSGRTALPMAPPKGWTPPCGICEKVPEGVRREKGGDWRACRAAAVDLGKARLAIGHFRQCKAVGRFPEDPVVERNAALFAEFEDARTRAPVDKLNSLLTQLLARGR